MGFETDLPHMDYAVLTILLQQECQFVQSVTPGVGLLFSPLEVELGDDFLPGLLGGRIEEITD